MSALGRQLGDLLLRTQLPIAACSTISSGSRSLLQCQRTAGAPGLPGAPGTPAAPGAAAFGCAGAAGAANLGARFCIAPDSPWGPGEPLRHTPRREPFEHSSIGMGGLVRGGHPEGGLVVARRCASATRERDRVERGGGQEQNGKYPHWISRHGYSQNSRILIGAPLSSISASPRDSPLPYFRGKAVEIGNPRGCHTPSSHGAVQPQWCADRLGNYPVRTPLVTYQQAVG